MTSIQALRERLAALSRAMNAQLAEKGDRVWTKDDQATFDTATTRPKTCSADREHAARARPATRKKNFDDDV
jgi:hypothetical protein